MRKRVKNSKRKNLKRRKNPVDSIPVPPTIQAICGKCKKKMVAGTTNEGLHLMCIKCKITINLVAMRSSDEY